MCVTLESEIERYIEKGRQYLIYLRGLGIVSALSAATLFCFFFFNTHQFSHSHPSYIEVPGKPSSIYYVELEAQRHVQELRDGSGLADES